MDVARLLVEASAFTLYCCFLWAINWCYDAYIWSQDVDHDTQVQFVGCLIAVFALPFPLDRPWWLIALLVLFIVLVVKHLLHKAMREIIYGPS